MPRGARLVSPSSKPASDPAEVRRLDALLARERELQLAGFERIAGVDEAGMGPLAGPVVAAAVILAPGLGLTGVNDSKQLRPALRASLAALIREHAVAWAVAAASVREIDTHNIRQAGLLAMRRALYRLRPAPDYVLVDARTLDGLPWPQEGRIRGDAELHAVACASILAKEHRDRLMEAYDQSWPEYGFAQHKGYGTPQHLAALRNHGRCPVHRRSFHWEKSQLPLL